MQGIYLVSYNETACFAYEPSRSRPRITSVLWPCLLVFGAHILRDCVQSTSRKVLGHENAALVQDKQHCNVPALVFECLCIVREFETSEHFAAAAAPSHACCAWLQGFEHPSAATDTSIPGRQARGTRSTGVLRVMFIDLLSVIPSTERAGHGTE